MMADQLYTHRSGYRPAGYIWNALAKGYRLGFEAASETAAKTSSTPCASATLMERRITSFWISGQRAGEKNICRATRNRITVSMCCMSTSSAPGNGKRELQFTYTDPHPAAGPGGTGRRQSGVEFSCVDSGAVTPAQPDFCVTCLATGHCGVSHNSS